MLTKLYLILLNEFIHKDHPSEYTHWAGPIPPLLECIVDTTEHNSLPIQIYHK